jgi:hypothetical protein
MSAAPPNLRTGVAELMDVLVKENAPELEPEETSNPGRAAASERHQHRASKPGVRRKATPVSAGAVQAER